MEITKETIKIPSDVVINLNKFVNTSRIDIDYIDGRIIKFNKTNLATCDPCRIIFSNKQSFVEVLIYLDNKSFYIANFDEALHFKRLVGIVNKYL